MQFLSLFYCLVAIINCVMAIWFGIKGNEWAMGWAAALSGAFLVVANIDRIAEFSLGVTGIKASIREIKEVRVALTDLQELSAAMVRAILTATESAGRVGGLPDKRKNEQSDRLISVLEHIKVPSNLLEEVFIDIHRYVAFDYAHYILGGAVIPARQNSQLHADWKAIRGKGLEQIATPDEIQSYLEKYTMLTDYRKEFLEDYRFYLEHHKHRRPEIWAQREEWGRL